jgi:hypothetical protein
MLVQEKGAAIQDWVCDMDSLFQYKTVLTLKRVWTSFLGWAGVVVPLINHGIGSIDGSLSSWRYIFFVAGSIITLWGLLLPFLLSPNPQSARGIWLRLSTREQDIAVHRLRENNTGLPNVEFKMEQGEVPAVFPRPELC